MNQHKKTEEYHRRLSRSTLLARTMQTQDHKKEPDDTDPDQEIMNLVIDNVLAPALNGFVVWVLRKAMEKRIERLYFLARDGYLMYRTAVNYVRKYDLPVECRYLYCSRYSVRVPAYHLDEESALSYITLGGLDVTADKIYQRAGLHAGQRKRLHEEEIISYGKSEQIPRKELGQVREKLRQSDLFMEYMRENSHKAFPAYEQYLKQEGMTDKVIAALVDSGWVGSMQKELEQSLRRLGRKEPLNGFYWGLYEIPSDMDRDFYHTYFFSPESEIRRKTIFNNCLFETIFTAPHGMTLGYRECGEKIEPVLSKMQPERRDRLIAIEERFATWQERMFDQVPAKSFAEIEQYYEEGRTFRAICKNLELFMHHPTREEACAFGKMDFTDDVLETKGNQIAAGISIRRSAWYEGSATINRKHPKCYIALYAVYKLLLYERQRSRYMRREHIK